MKDDKGKVILSLLAGATAGIVAGLLLAPETGDAARSNLRESAKKWGGDLSKLLKSTLAKAQGGEAAGHTNPNARVSEDKQAADRLLQGLDAGAEDAAVQPGDLSTLATGNGSSVGGNTDAREHLTEQ
ncbi:YtxH domain-containing protein [Hymenobacter ruricola]|uniref:YtxH domain-containing protein n=1 Tax=Hymenobacter ruricola TaxID=2791023 RepID=A0ABS0I539_9BACT|nr:YtxH domain-containing protein [Hymenobacter ruricola]MBF9222061.1 YtxH domain-containing protein [Hymenobacter ruricola]